MDPNSVHATIFRRGNKAELFSEADKLVDEEQELESKLRDLHAVWSLPRSGKDLAAAIWRPDLQLAEVVLPKGKLFSYIGFLQGNKLFLHIEEAVYLVDRANMLLFLDQGGHEKRLLSTQECHDLMVGSGVGMEQYLVYCKLARSGYVVHRHPAQFVLSAADDPREVWGSWNGSQQQQQQNQQRQQQQNQQQQQQQQQQSQPSPAQPAAPETVGADPPPSKWRKLDKAASKQEEKAAGWFPPATDGGSWMSFLPEDFYSKLPRMEVAPDAASAAKATLPQMLSLQPLPTEELVPIPAVGHSLLHYDAFLATSKFSRRKPGKPTFMVAIHPCSKPPTLEEIAAAELAAGSVPVRHSTIEKGDICFYTIGQVSLAEIWE